MEQQITADIGVQEAAFIIAGWSVDLSTLRIHKQEESVKLEPKVMAVLEYLAERPGQVVSRQELEENIWAGTVVGYDAISNAIIKLRKAFGDDAQRPQIIETIPKAGYRLIAPVEALIETETQSREFTVSADPGDSEASTGRSFQPPRWKLVFTIAMPLLLLVAGVLLIFQPWVEQIEPASIERMAFPLPDKPSIALLPFTNMSADTEQEYFTDGITEDLTTELSRVEDLFVVARNSAFSYKGREVEVHTVAEELGVRYVLKGSVQRSGDQVRINARLIDALSGGQVWAERYNETTGNLFLLQDKIVNGIVKSLAVKLSLDYDADRADSKLVDAEAYDLFLRGWGHYRAGSADDYATAVELFRQALKQDPEFARARAALAAVYWKILRKGLYQESLGIPYYVASERARRLLRESQQNPTALTHQIASESTAFHSRSPRLALEEAEIALQKDPNDPAGYLAMGNALLKADKPQQALKFIRDAMRLDPQYPADYLVRLAQAQFQLGDYSGARESLETAVNLVPDDDWAWVYLAATYGQLSESDSGREALATADRLRAKSGWGPVTRLVASDQLFRWQGKKDKFKEGLQRAGAPTGGEWYALISDKDSPDGYQGVIYDVKGAQVIDALEAKAMHERGVVFVGINSTWINGHMPGSHFLQFWREQPEGWLFNEASLGKLISKDQEVVIFGPGDGHRNVALACALAVSRGFTRVYYFRGGIKAWKAAGFPVEKAAADEF